MADARVRTKRWTVKQACPERPLLVQNQTSNSSETSQNASKAAERSYKYPHSSHARKQPRLPGSVSPRLAGRFFASPPPGAVDELKAHHISHKSSCKPQTRRVARGCMLRLRQ